MASITISAYMAGDTLSWSVSGTDAKGRPVSRTFTGLGSLVSFLMDALSPAPPAPPPAAGGSPHSK